MYTKRALTKSGSLLLGSLKKETFQIYLLILCESFYKENENRFSYPSSTFLNDFNHILLNQS